VNWYKAPRQLQKRVFLKDIDLVRRRIDAISPSRRVLPQVRTSSTDIMGDRALDNVEAALDLDDDSEFRDLVNTGFAVGKRRQIR
jgi:hypothetical protein